MNKNKFNSRELIEKSLTLTDSISELDAIIEKIYVISSDLFENYIERTNFKTEKGKLIAEFDFKVIKVMVDVCIVILLVHRKYRETFLNYRIIF